MLASVIWIQCETWTSLIDCLHFPVVSCIIPLSVTFVLEMLRLWRNLQFLARTCSEVSVILMHPHKLRCSKCLQFSVKVIIAVSDTLMQRRRYTVWSWQQEVKTLMTPSEVMSSLEFLVAFKSVFLNFYKRKVKRDHCLISYTRTTLNLLRRDATPFRYLSRWASLAWIIDELALPLSQPAARTMTFRGLAADKLQLSNSGFVSC